MHQKMAYYAFDTETEEKAFYFWKSGANLDVLVITRLHMHREHVLLSKCHELVISKQSIFEFERSDQRPQRPKARASDDLSHH